MDAREWNEFWEDVESFYCLFKWLLYNYCRNFIAKLHYLVLWIPQINWPSCLFLSRQCSRSCGRGVKMRSVKCTELSNGTVRDDSGCANLPKPKERTECFVRHCPYTWLTSDWTQVETLSMNIWSAWPFQVKGLTMIVKALFLENDCFLIERLKWLFKGSVR